jgi:hypothetical protein
MAGRPLKFQSVDELEEAIKEYFDECDPHIADVLVYTFKKKKVNRGKHEWEEDDLDSEPTPEIKRRLTKQIPYSVAGLAVALDCSRDTLLLYESGYYDDLVEGDDEYNPLAASFSDTIKKAKDKILAQKEVRFLNGEVNPIAGIFDLKVNHGYQDKIIIDDTGEKKYVIETRQAGSADRPQPLAIAANAESIHDKKARAGRASVAKQFIEAELVDDDDMLFEHDTPVEHNPIQVIRTIVPVES